VAIKIVANPDFPADLSREPVGRLQAVGIAKAGSEEEPAFSFGAASKEWYYTEVNMSKIAIIRKVR